MPGEEIRQVVVARVQGKKSDDTFEDIITDDAGRLQVWDPKVGSLISYTGTTTADGAPLGASLIDALLAAQPDFDGHLVIITSGPCAGQARDINGITTGGTVTPSIHFGSPTGAGVQIVSGTSFIIAGITTTPAEVAAIEAKLDHAAHGLAALKALIDAVEGKLDGVSGLAAIKAVVDAILVDTETTLEGKLDAIGVITTAILTDTETTIPGLLATIQADLDNPNQYKADVSALALEATLGTHDTDIKALLNPKVMGRLQIKATTIDLNQGAGTYDLFTAATQDVVVEALVIRMSGGTLVGSTVTSISIQTDDATPIVFIDATAGAVANLTNEAQLAWTGAALLDAGTSAKITVTIVGGVAGAAKVCDVMVEYRAVVSGGELT